MGIKKFMRAGQGKHRCWLVVARTVITIKTMIGFIKKQRRVGLRLFDNRHIIHRDMASSAAKWNMMGTLGVWLISEATPPP